MNRQIDFIDVKFFKGFIRRRKETFLVVASVILIASVILTFVLPRAYESSATILIEGRVTEDLMKSLSMGNVEERLLAITQQILSRDRLLEIINQFQLYSPLDDQADIEKAIETMRKNLSISTIRTEDLDRRPSRGMYNTVAFRLAYQGEDPVTVQKVASRLAALYIEQNAQKKGELANQAAVVLQQRLNQYKEQTEKLGQRLSEFKRQHAGGLPESIPFNMEQVSRLNTQLEEVNSRIRLLDERSTVVDRQSSSMSSQNSLTGNRTASDPWTRLAQLRLDLDNLRSRYSEKHPDIIRTKSEIQQLEVKLGMSGVSSGQNERKESELSKYIRQRDEIQRKINEYQRKTQMAPVVQSEYTKLNSDYENAMKQYNETMEKLADAKAFRGIEEAQLGERFTIIDEPVVPQKPEKPKRIKILLAGFFMSIMGGLFASVIVENLDHSIRSVDQLQKVTKLPVLTILPYIKTEEEEAQDKYRVFMKRVDDVKNYVFRMIAQGRKKLSV
jgi:polysaccharide chain length determinant protein (PEP-CTERM system associated)